MPEFLVPRDSLDLFLSTMPYSVDSCCFLFGAAWQEFPAGGDDPEIKFNIAAPAEGSLFKLHSLGRKGC